MDWDSYERMCYQIEFWQIQWFGLWLNSRQIVIFTLAKHQEILWTFFVALNGKFVLELLNWRCESWKKKKVPCHLSLFIFFPDNKCMWLVSFHSFLGNSWNEIPTFPGKCIFISYKEFFYTKRFLLAKSTKLLTFSLRLCYFILSWTSPHRRFPSIYWSLSSA